MGAEAVTGTWLRPPGKCMAQVWFKRGTFGYTAQARRHHITPAHTHPNCMSITCQSSYHNPPENVWWPGTLGRHKPATFQRHDKCRRSLQGGALSSDEALATVTSFERGLSKLFFRKAWPTITDLVRRTSGNHSGCSLPTSQSAQLENHSPFPKPNLLWGGERYETWAPPANWSSRHSIILL